VISYSLYLWQQMFTGSKAHFPLNLLAILACAELSYWLVERPSFRARDWLALRSTKRWGLAGAAGEAHAVQGTGGN
jgi:peptidoglycan/LPS O-acetylase OafA/YrhL